MCIALATVTGMVKLFRFPTGGSITLASTLFATLPGYFFGPIPGLISGIAYGLLHAFINPFILTPLQAIIDYGFAFAAYGLSGFFCQKKKGLLIGYLVSSIARWFFAFLSGWIYFGEYAWEGWGTIAYSAVYNLIYIGGEVVIVLLVLSIPAVEHSIQKIKEAAVSKS